MPMFKIYDDIQTWFVQFTDQKKQLKKVIKDWNWPVNNGHKSKMVSNEDLNYKSMLKFLDICEIKDSIDTIYWLTKMD